MQEFNGKWRLQRQQTQQKKGIPKHISRREHIFIVVVIVACNCLSLKLRLSIMAVH